MGLFAHIINNTLRVFIFSGANINDACVQNGEKVTLHVGATEEQQGTSELSESSPMIPIPSDTLAVSVRVPGDRQLYNDVG